MLKRIRVNNVKSLLNVEFRPGGINLLIGPNNAGKTNLCSAIHFLGLSSFVPLDDAAGIALSEMWNIANISVSSPIFEIEIDCSLPRDGQLIHFNYQVQISSRKWATPGKSLLELVSERLLVSGAEPSLVPILENKAGQVRLLRESSTEPGSLISDRQDHMETSAPTDATMLYRLYDVEAHPVAHLFKNYLTSWSYFNFSATALRSAKMRTPPWRRLVPDGENFSSVLFLAHNENPRLEKKIIDIVRTIEPKLAFLTYFSPDPESVYLSMEDEKGNRFGVQSISDGTLRFMAMTFVILAAAERDELTPTPLIIVEEPENGLYVGHLKPLIERIDKEGKGGQFIFTTHSPYFIDLFDSMLEGVHLMKPGVPSSILMKPDPDRTRKLLEVMPLGELHYREMLT
jgi:predicted ATPase